MKLFFFLLLTSCTGFFSSSIKKTNHKNVTSSKWEQMYAVFEQKCLVCHTNFGDSEEAFLANGLFVPGKPENSIIVTRLLLNPYNQDEADMPKGGLEWNESELLKFIEWVKNSKITIPEIVVKAGEDVLTPSGVFDLGFVVKGSDLQGKRQIFLSNNSNSEILINEVKTKKSEHIKVESFSSSSVSPEGTIDFYLTYSSDEIGVKNDTLIVDTSRGTYTFDLSFESSSLLSSVGVSCNQSQTRKINDYVKPLVKNQLYLHLKNILDPLKENNYAQDFLNDNRISSLFDLYPNLTSKEYQENSNGGLINEHMSSMTLIAMKLGEMFSEDESYFSKLKLVVKKSCESVGNIEGVNSSCLDDIIKHFSRYAYSREITSVEFSKLKEIYNTYLSTGDKKTSLQSAITSVLLHPEAWMLIDTGDNLVLGQEFKRSKSGLIRILSFTLTDSSPDEFLINKSLTENIFSEDKFNNLVNHLKQVQNEQGENLYSLKALDIVSGYLGLSQNQGYGSSGAILNGVLPYYANKGIDINQTTFGSHANDNKRSDEILLKYLVYDEGLSVNSLLDSKYKVSLNPIQKYVQKTHSVSLTPQISSQSQGSGIFINHAIFANSVNSFYRSPPHTASEILEKFACLEIGSPDNVPGLEPNDLEPPEVDPSMSVTERFTSITSQSPVCLSCHRVMDPISYVLQEVNSLGDVTKEEVHFNDSGEELVTHFLDTKQILNIHGQSYEVDGVFELANIFKKTGTLSLCLTQEFLRNAYQSDEIKKLGCEVETSFSSMMNQNPVRDTLINIVKEPHFRNIKFDPVK